MADNSMGPVLRYYQLFAEDDFETMESECFHPEVTWIMPGHHPMSGVHHGSAAAIAFLRKLKLAGIFVDNVHIGVLDDGTVIEKHIGHGEGAGGEKFTFPTATSYGIKDGKIFEVQVHTGDQHNVDRYFWGRYPLKGVPDRLA